MPPAQPGRPSRSGWLALLTLAAALWQGGALAAQDVPGNAPPTPDQGVAVIQAPEGDQTAAPDAMMGLLPVLPLTDPAAAVPKDRLRGPAGAPPVVIELSPAQGCSSCPPADELVASLAGRDDVLPLAWHVDYWDYLGWADEFARPENTLRQRAYAEAAGEHGIYTPQIIVDGQDTLISVHQSGLLALIDDHAARPPAVSVTAQPDARGFVIDLMPRAAVPGGVEVTLIRYAPGRRVTIRAGENRGQTLEYANIVLGSEPIARWDARAPLRLTVTAGDRPDDRFPSDTLHAILAQQLMPGGLPGPILAAVRLD
ncbi:MAG TPA: DUF1223 domain-containing protein [Paracoccus sp. (in: a-proteobacteria)]|nr:DUF1223 domain-containing protein [Paracoccus sp. (in: a-proteobacteria)]